MVEVGIHEERKGVPRDVSAQSVADDRVGSRLEQAAREDLRGFPNLEGDGVPGNLDLDNFLLSVHCEKTVRTSFKLVIRHLFTILVQIEG